MPKTDKSRPGKLIHLLAREPVSHNIELMIPSVQSHQSMPIPTASYADAGIQQTFVPRKPVVTVSHMCDATQLTASQCNGFNNLSSKHFAMAALSAHHPTQGSKLYHFNEFAVVATEG